jgi:LysR family transcriptional regulator, carnitine catabolism transcriptional activator
MSVARTGSFSETARQLRTSQPALSGTIHLLEDQMGVRLFDRDTRNVSLTAAGTALLPVVERLSADFEQSFSALAQTFAGERGRVVVGALPSIAATLLPELICSFRRTHPGVEIIVRDTLSRSIEGQFMDRHVDLGLIALSGPDDQFDFTPILTEPFGLVSLAGGPLDTEGSARWELFATHPFIAMAAMSSVRHITDAALIEAGVGATPLFECAHLATVGGLIAAGLGISALPRSTLTLLGGHTFSWRPLDHPSVSRTIGLAKLAKRSLPAAAEAFAQHIVTYASQRFST